MGHMGASPTPPRGAPGRGNPAKDRPCFEEAAELVTWATGKPWGADDVRKCYAERKDKPTMRKLATPK